MNRDFLVQEEEYKGFKFEIHQDEDAQDPRGDDNLGIMCCWHRRYSLGDTGGTRHEATKRDGTKIPHRFMQFPEPQDFHDWWYGKKDEDGEVEYVENGKGGVLLSLYLYDHSGISMSTGREYPFNCPWDSGQVGWIYCTAEMIKKEWKVKRISKVLHKKVEECLRGEVELYDMYLRGDVYGYIVHSPLEEDEDDSCWGYFGLKECIAGAKESIDERIKNMNGRVSTMLAYAKGKTA